MESKKRRVIAPPGKGRFASRNFHGLFNGPASGSDEITVGAANDHPGAKHHDRMMQQLCGVAGLGQSKLRPQQRPKLRDFRIVDERFVLEFLGPVTQDLPHADKSLFPKRKRSCQ